MLIKYIVYIQTLKNIPSQWHPRPGPDLDSLNSSWLVARMWTHQESCPGSWCSPNPPPLDPNLPRLDLRRTCVHLWGHLRPHLEALPTDWFALQPITAWAWRCTHGWCVCLGRTALGDGQEIVLVGNLWSQRLGYFIKGDLKIQVTLDPYIHPFKGNDTTRGNRVGGSGLGSLLPRQGQRRL